MYKIQAAICTIRTIAISAVSMYYLIVNVIGYTNIKKDGRKMTIYDIAELAGVSTATVSRVVNGSPRVSESTKRRVMEIMERNDYSPNPFARGLQVNSMKTVGIVCSDIADEYMARSVSAIEKNLRPCGYDYMLYCSGYTQEGREHAVDSVLKKKVDALILIGSQFMGSSWTHEETDYVRRAAEQVPVFMINGYVDAANVYCILSDDFGAMHDTACAMLGAGRKRILFLHDSDSYSAMQKMKGYEAALKENGMPVLGELKLKLTGGINEVRDILLSKRTLEFDAAVCTTDELAVSVIKYARDRELAVPGDLEVTGYNDSVLAVSCEPELSSVYNSVQETDAAVVNGLVKCLAGEETEHRTVLKAKLIRRSTTDF